MAAWWRSSPQIRGREVVLVALAAALLAVVFFWPLAAHLGTDIPLDLGDPLPQSWQIAWDGHALATQPLHFFQSNQFWPLHDSLAFSDALIGYTPAGLIGHGPRAAVVRYDLLFLFAFALAFLGAYLLARELGAPPWAAAVAGAAFACAPWRLEQGGHLHVLSSGGIPITLFLLLRGWRRERPGMIVGGFAVASWQMALGFSLGLQLGYLLLLLGLVAVISWWRAGRARIPRRLIVATIAGGVLLTAVSVVLARPYLRVLDAHPEAKRSQVTVSRYSGPLKMFAAAPETSLVWGRATSSVRDTLDAVPEQTLFPGLAILLLAIAGLGWKGYPRPLRVGLGLGALALALLSLGFQEHGIGRFLPYRLLYELLPGWQGIRVPGRLNTLTTLLLALLAAGGAARAAGALRTRRGARAATVGAAALLLVVVIEGSGFGVNRGGEALAGYPHPTVPAAPAGLAGLRAPLLQLPTAREDNRRYLLWSTDGFPKMLNGRTSFDPTFFNDVRTAVACFPDRASVAFLRRLGVHTVVVHTDLPPDPEAPACRTGSAAPEQLGLQRTRRGPLVVYDLG